MNYKKIKITDKEYPQILRKIKNPPAQLYVIGNIELLHQNNFAIVGSRKCSEAGFKIAKKFSRALSEYGLNIISGMAVGIDSAAHLGCLETNGKTIAVLGSGFNCIFPKENEKLFKRIIENDGIVISEYTPDTKPDKTLFPKRNRIISGLSIGVLVVEAKYRSGSIITAQYARAQKRDVYSIPHALEDKYGIGTNRLIKNGAKLVTEPLEIIKQYEKILKIEKQTKNEKIEKIKKIDINEEYKEIYDVLSDIPKHINEITRQLKLSVQEANNKLMLMEIEGYIIQKNINEYIIK